MGGYLLRTSGKKLFRKVSPSNITGFLHWCFPNQCIDLLTLVMCLCVKNGKLVKIR